MQEPELFLDLKPTFSDRELASKINNSVSDNILSTAIRAWRMSEAAASLLRAYASPDALHSPLLLSQEAKALRISLTGPSPIAEAISSAGGVSFTELDDQLMVRRLPGLFLAGEMLDWEAPTGGYLLQGCFATGTRAAKGVFGYLSRRARD
jgi:predicted flavoprotein YhiN